MKTPATIRLGNETPEQDMPGTTDRERNGDVNMLIVWHGTAAVEIACGDSKILFDPFVPLKHSLVDVTLEEFDGFRDIFVTHGHFDHIVNIPEIIRRNPGVCVHCTDAPFRTLRRKGVPAENLDKITYCQTITVGGMEIQTFHGRHAVLPSATPALVWKFLKSPARGNLHYILREHRRSPENDETLFYQIRAQGKTLALMGSLNLRDDVAYPRNADALILPYNGWTDNFLPACRALERLRPKRVLLDHYDVTFPPLTAPIDLTPILARPDVRVDPLELRRVVEV